MKNYYPLPPFPPLSLLHNACFDFFDVIRIQFVVILTKVITRKTSPPPRCYAMPAVFELLVSLYVL